MNQTRSNFPHPLMKCPCLRLFFEYYYKDILILQIYYIFTAIAIVTSNGLLLYKLLKKRLKTRADKMFIILSCSDIGVGLSSVPMSSLPLFVKNFDALCMLSPILRFFFSYSLQFFLVRDYNCCTWQSSNDNKRIQIQKIRHNEAFIWPNNIFPIN